MGLTKLIKSTGIITASLTLGLTSAFVISSSVKADSTSEVSNPATNQKILSVFDLNMHSNEGQEANNHTMGGVLSDEALKAAIDESGSTSKLHYLRMPASLPEASVTEWVKVAKQTATADRMKTGRIQEIIQVAPTVATIKIGSSIIPKVDAVDIASYQDWLTRSDFQRLKQLGVSTVVVKVTEGDSYVNPAAPQ